jgi:xylulose-5-phosphate/fructose-6-phosphate phosphoketolase
VHLNRLIVKHDLNAIFIAGPGHGAPGVLAPVYLEGTYSEVYPDKARDEEGLKLFFKEFSFPGGIGSHCTPETPGSIHEGGELGYSLSHAFGAAFDNPDLLVAAVVGDGEAETGPLATSWHSNKFLNPIRDGAVLPILNLNGYKINNPTLLARIPREELLGLLEGYGWAPRLVEGDDPRACTRSWPRRSRTACSRSADCRPRPARAAGRARALADDRARHAQGLDRAEVRRRQEGRGLLARAPGAAVGRARQPAASRAARAVAALVPPGGALRPGRPARARARRACRPPARAA